MTYKRYTDEEIIKGLECMLGMINNDIEYSIDCNGCAFEDNALCSETCSEGIAKYALDLINRQKAEIERLRAKVETRTQEKLALGRIYTQKLKTVKYETYYEAYKEFAERIRECCDLNDDLSTDAWLSVTADIDCVLKEMSGEQ